MEENKQFNKKWLFFIAILVLIAIIIVSIIVFMPGNPHSTVVALKNDQQNQLYGNSEVSKIYDNYETKVGNSSVSKYTEEMADVQIVLKNIEIIVDEYGKFATYFKENEFFYENYKPATENLNKIKEIKSEIVEELQKVEKNYNEEASDFLRSSWLKVRNSVAEMLDCYYVAFSTLNDIFRESYFGFEQNLASQTAFSAMNDYVAVLAKKYENLSNSDVINISISNYKYDFSSIVDAFNIFIEKYENQESGFKYDILNYYFDTTNNIAEKYDKINSFYQLYSIQNFQEIVESATIVEGKVEFTKTFSDITDSDNIYQEVKNYLGGR